ncbi:GNAT family N-acetyltransferase [Marmoricola sp. URHB0036]|uniref:GNAT family N-acetyltransferase n=1 Tax=Marmoricola sp. URHB0036 TaxID=1298863 RepID=UPI0003F70C22|nr:GNAT family N-acetyltransferase [Marmoricola sp. URHB0036]
MPTDPSEPTDLVLRPATEDDLTEVLAVFAAASQGPGQPLESRSPEQVRAWVQDLPARGQEIWVATRDDTVLGFLSLRGSWVPLLFVHPERPGRGVGAALIDLAKGLRPHGFGLRVHEANTRARDFYRRHGLIELESTDGSSYDDDAPDVQMAWLGDLPLAYLRGRIDEVDDELAVLLARRVALAAAVQDHKEVGGHAGRDPEREAEIVQRMAEHVPSLDRDVLATIMHTVIAESLAAWERGSGQAG